MRKSASAVRLSISADDDEVNSDNELNDDDARRDASSASALATSAAAAAMVYEIDVRLTVGSIVCDIMALPPTSNFAPSTTTAATAKTTTTTTTTTDVATPLLRIAFAQLVASLRVRDDEQVRT